MQVQERHARWSVRMVLGVVLAVAAAGGPGTAVAAGDALFVGYSAPSSIVRFPVAGTGLSAGSVFVQGGPANSPDPNALNGPRGLIFVNGSLWVANQNAGRHFTGGINQYGSDGAFAGTVISAVHSNKISAQPFAPRGIVLWQGHLVVADVQGGDPVPPAGTIPDGAVEEYTEPGALPARLPAPPDVAFHPRGAVVGPDGALYVSNAPNLTGTGGQVLRYSGAPGARTVQVVIDCSATSTPRCPLNRPEGLVFGPDRTLYVTSFNDPADPAHTNDKILEYRNFGPTGQIDLDPVGGGRTSAQALVFGPGGGLYVAILQTGDIRRYNVGHPTNPETVASPGPANPFYLAFGQTDPGTLAYHG